MQSNTMTQIIESRCELAEGVFYSATQQCIFWVDIIGQTLFRYHSATQSVSRFAMEEPICWLMETAHGQLLAGFKRAIYQLTINVEQQSYQRTLMFSLADEPPSNRLNDAKTDRNGFAYFGTMDNAEQQQQGALYRFGHGQPPVQVDNDYMISNGPAVSQCGRWLYSTDSAKRTIYRFALNSQGQLSDKQPFIIFSESMGFPDGMTVDSENCLWVAAWGGYGVYRFSAEGEKIHFIPLPAPNVTCVAFVGRQREQMAITTARVGLSTAQLQQYQHSGDVFIINPGVRGIAETPVRV